MASLLQPAERARFDQQFALVREMPPPIPEEERFRASIEDVGVGGYIRFEDDSYRVTGKNHYEREGVRWPELILYRLNDGTTQYLEWEKEDAISIYVSRETLSFGEVGLRDKEHLWKMAEDGEGAVRYGGKSFRYHEDSAVSFFRDGSSESKPFHQYLFANENRKVFVGVEEWGDEDHGFEHNVILSAYLDPAAVEVLVRNGPND